MNEIYRVNQVYRVEDPQRIAGLLGARLMTMVAELAPSSVVTLEMANNGTGGTDIRLWDPVPLPIVDLNWVFDTGLELVTDESSATEADDSLLLSKVVCTAANHRSTEAGFGFGVAPVPAYMSKGWPTGLQLGADLVEAIADTPGLAIRWHLQPADPAEIAAVEDLLTNTWTGAPAELQAYLGQPLRARLLVASGAALSPRVRGLLRQGSPTLTLTEQGRLSDPRLRTAWEGQDLAGAALPQGAVAALLQFPSCGTKPIRGVRTGERPAEDRVLDTELPESGIRLGTAQLSTGATTSVRLGTEDLMRHMQIIGQTGTGKSTALAALVQEAARAGRGVTLIDPHGSTVDRIIAEADWAYADRIRVIRCADPDHVIPINPWAGRGMDSLEEEVAATVELLYEIFDPGRTGIVGPRFERWFGQLAMLSQALLGPRASLMSVALLGRDRTLLDAAAKRVAPTHRDLVAQVMQEIIGMKGGSDTADFDAWVNSKLQRLLATGQLRAVLGSGFDGLALPARIADQGITLIDLGMPQLGTSGARVLGTFVLQQLWAAVLERSDRTDHHLLLVDEAHLFQHGVLPSILAEGRKFGIGAVIAHQHQGQLAPALNQALEANSASLLAFRCALEDAVRLSARLGGWSTSELTRIPAGRAAATITVGTGPSDPFTLVVDHNERVGRPSLTSETATGIITGSQLWARTFRHHRPITTDDIRAAARQGDPVRTNSSELATWLSERKASAG